MNLHIARAVLAILAILAILDDKVYNEKFGWDVARCKCKCRLFPAMSMGMDQRYMRECRA